MGGSDGYDDGIAAAAASASERYKGRARPGPARDYVRYSDDEDEEATAAGFEADELLDLSELFVAADMLLDEDDGDGWGSDSDDEAFL